jgi:hypothetical protein
MKIEQQQDWLGQEQGEVGAKTMGQSDFCWWKILWSYHQKCSKDYRLKMFSESIMHQRQFLGPVFHLESFVSWLELWMERYAFWCLKIYKVSKH